MEEYLFEMIFFSGSILSLVLLFKEQRFFNIFLFVSSAIFTIISFLFPFSYDPIHVVFYGLLGLPALITVASFCFIIYYYLNKGIKYTLQTGNHYDI